MLWDPDLDAFSFLDWKVPSFIYADEGATLYVGGMCSVACLGGDEFTQIQTHSCPLFLMFMKWLPEEQQSWETKSPACWAKPAAVFSPEPARQQEYRNGLNYPLRLYYRTKQ